MDNKNIIIYTDGSCVKSVGGFGIVIVSKEGPSFDQPYYGRVPYDPCTNNIAELYSIYQALVLASDLTSIEIRTDSAYSIGCLTKWFPNWIQNGWKNSKGRPVENQLLIRSILDLLTHFDQSNRKVTFRHVRAHCGEYYNEWVDQLANEGRLV